MTDILQIHETLTAIEEARRAIARGWQVFPLAKSKKVPIKGSHGYLDATRDHSAIEAWAHEHPNCNWGMATGASSVVVLDVDVNRGGDETLRALIALHGQLPETAEVRSAVGADTFTLDRETPNRGEIG